MAVYHPNEEIYERNFEELLEQYPVAVDYNPTPSSSSSSSSSSFASKRAIPSMNDFYTNETNRKNRTSAFINDETKSNIRNRRVRAIGSVDRDDYDEEEEDMGGDNRGEGYRSVRGSGRRKR